MKRQLWLWTVLLVAACAGPAPEGAKTTFQTSRGWMAETDNRADAVMVYGADGTLEERMASWRERGYETHFMTGIAWGGYQAYFTGEWDGVPHWDEAQVAAGNDTIWHGPKAPERKRSHLSMMKPASRSTAMSRLSHTANVCWRDSESETTAALMTLRMQTATSRM